jgi:predicted AAA+ superfamily ATPase
MKRKIYNELLEWKRQEQGRVAILIDGARRIGKSYIAEEFARREYKSYILIDFNRVGKEIRELFDNNMSNLDTLFMLLQNITGVKLYERNSLIIFDEVQMYPRARAAIKYLVADGRYDYLETGSLVSINTNVKEIVIPSEERRLSMFPMDFEEFLWAMGDDMLMPFLHHCFEQRSPLGAAMHRKALDLFRLYMIVGGMPQAIERYITTHDFVAVDRIKRDILRLYKTDIEKYASGYETKVKSIFDEIPAALQRHEKRFRIADIHSAARFRTYETSFFWLEESQVVNVCRGASEPTPGLRMKMDGRQLKCYMADTGLLISHAFDEKTIVGEELYRKLLLDKLEINKGMLVENVVAQMLRAAGHKLYFYSHHSPQADERMEIDFLIQKPSVTSRHNISPVEVKSSTRYTLSSLNKFRTKFKAELSTPYVIHYQDLKVDDGILYLPIYMTPLL